ncbi:hypothetical protein DSM112329_01258 [Paraconexibacter sp. AEG42_29]|uniref:DUF2029 domain-containing protein n=1 Tax=Paraconexibacter sp. AEG42_29 TaxID=2997339 RepID=A0AAU7ARV8_9ACTN
MATTAAPPTHLEQLLPDPVVPVRQPSRKDAALDLAEPVGWTLASLTVVFWGLRMWAGSALYGPVNGLACAMTLAGLAGCVAAWTLEGRAATVARAALLGLWAAGFAVFALLMITANPAYGTDAMAFNQRAAELLVDGTNPYTASLASSLDRFMVPEQYHTWLLDGGQVDQLSYPALSFLVYVPALLLGAGMQTAFVVNIAAWTATIVLLFVLLPARLRWAALVLGTLTNYVDFAVGGVTDVTFMPFLLLALWRWDRFGDPAERSAARWLGPVALALAMCIKQTPWFVLPFLLVALAFEAQHRPVPRGWWRLPARYLVVVVGVFAVVNAPFVVWDPGAFLHGMLVPFVEPTVPAGQGLITLALFQRLGGQLVVFKLTGLAAVPLMLLVFTVGYRRLKPALIPLTAIVFFWSTRSYASYLIDLLPAAFVAGVTVRSAPAAATLGRRRGAAKVAVAAGCVAFAGLVTVALASPQPLEMRIVGMQTTGQQQSVRQITVKVHNNTGAAVTPVFSIMAGQYLTRAWRPKGSALVPAHGEATVTLAAPNQQSMPAIEGGWVVTAFSRRPDALSTSVGIPANADRLSMVPSTINAPVAVGQHVPVKVQLRNRLGAAQRRAGVRVSLGQVVYTQDGILGGETRINGSPVGQSPVTAVTDDRGLAHFDVVGATALEAPVFFQAWINPSGEAPHAYSAQLAITFTDPVAP